MTTTTTWTAETIRQLRERLEETQEGMARRLDVSFPTYGNWERGKFKPDRRSRASLDRLEARTAREGSR